MTESEQCMDQPTDPMADMTPLVCPDSLLMHTIQWSSRDTIYFKDLHSRYIWNSLAHATLFGLDNPSEMRNKTDADYFSPEFAKRTLEEEATIIRTGNPLIANIEKWTSPTGKEHWFSAFKYPLKDLEGNIIGTWGTTRDITDLKRAEAELARKNSMLKRLSRIDELSGLYNRRYFYEVLKKNEALFSRRNSAEENTFSLISVDVDNFKTINDTYGHGKGDEVIRHVSEIMLINSRESDIVFRIGGDEYMVLLPDTNTTAAHIQAERIRKQVERNPIILDGQPVRLTVSLGVACYSDHNDIDELIHVADNRLYMSKNLGRNRAT